MHTHTRAHAHVRAQTHTYIHTHTLTGHLIEQAVQNILSHPCDPVLQFLMSGIGPPGKLERLFPLIPAHLPQLPCELVIFLIPRGEHSKTLVHHLNQFSDIYI